MSCRRNQQPVNYGLYRSRSGMICGVAKGLAMSSCLPVWVVRVGFIFFGLLTQVFPVLVVYIVLAVVMRPEPVVDFTTEEDREFYNTYGNERRSALHRMKDILGKLEKRVQRLETAVTDPEKDWERRFRNS